MALVVIGILAALVLTKFSSAKDKTYIDAEKNDLRNFTTVAELALDDNGTYPETPGALTTFHYSRDVSTLGYLPFGEGFHLIVQHAKTATVCGVTFGPARSTSPTCADASTVTFTGTANASTLFVDGSNGLSVSGRHTAGAAKTASLAGRATFSSAQAAPLTSGDLANIVYVDWEFGDGYYASFAGAGGLKTTHVYANPADGHTVRLAITFNDGTVALGAGTVAGGTITPVGFGAPPAGSTGGAGTPDTTAMHDTTGAGGTKTTNHAPLAAFTWSPAAVYQGAPVTFDASTSTDPDGDALTYAWDSDEWQTGTGVTTQQTFSTQGAHSVRLIANDPRGLADTLTQSLTVLSAAPTASFGVSPASPMSGDTAHFDASGSTTPTGTITSYAWTFGDGATGVGAQPTHVFAHAGATTVTLVVTNSVGASSSTNQTVSIGNRAPTALFSFSPASISVGDTILVDASGSTDADGTIVSYAWSFSDGAAAAGKTATHAFTTTGTYTATLTVTDNLGATATQTQTLNVAAAPTVLVDMRPLTASPSGCSWSGNYTAVSTDTLNYSDPSAQITCAASGYSHGFTTVPATFLRVVTLAATNQTFTLSATSPNGSVWTFTVIARAATATNVGKTVNMCLGFTGGWGENMYFAPGGSADNVGMSTRCPAGTARATAWSPTSSDVVLVDRWRLDVR